MIADVVPVTAGKTAAQRTVVGVGRNRDRRWPEGKVNACEHFSPGSPVNSKVLPSRPPQRHSQTSLSFAAFAETVQIPLLRGARSGLPGRLRCHLRLKVWTPLYYLLPITYYLLPITYYYLSLPIDYLITACWMSRSDRGCGAYSAPSSGGGRGRRPLSGRP